MEIMTDKEAVKFVKWLAVYFGELTTEVPSDAKIKGYEELLVKAFHADISPHDEELIAIIPYRGSDPDLVERDRLARDRIKHPLLRGWLDGVKKIPFDKFYLKTVQPLTFVADAIDIGLREPGKEGVYPPSLEITSENEGSFIIRKGNHLPPPSKGFEYRTDDIRWPFLIRFQIQDI